MAAVCQASTDTTDDGSGCSYATSASVSGEDWPGIIKYYWELLITTIRPSKMIFKMRLSPDCCEVGKAFSLDLEDRCTEAAQIFLAYLMEEKEGTTQADMASQWSLFDEVLKSDYLWLRDILLGRSSTGTEVIQQRELINFFRPEICEKVDPAHLRPELYAHSLLDTTECEKLGKICDQHGPAYGAMYMLGHIHRNTPDWYYKFLAILVRNGYDEVVKKLVGEDKYNDKFSEMSESAESAGCLLPVSEVMETFMEVEGCAHEPRQPNYAAPNQSDEEKMNDHDSDLDETETLQKMKFSLMDAEDVTESKAVMASDVESLNVACNQLNDPAQDENKRESLTGKNVGMKNVLPAEALHSDNSNAELGGVGDADESDKVGEPIELRDYQQELAERALGDKNVIICAPTGSGKTHVALKIMQNHLQQKGKGVRKVVFLVNQVALANQQYKQCEKYLKPFRCQLVSGDAAVATKVPLPHLLMRADILVMTAQILLDALVQKEIRDICEFSLVVFDECHHTDHRHPFNCVMHHYMAVKFAEDRLGQDRQLPQVIGLTASVGVGKAGTHAKAINHIRKLCAHLDADYICTVTQNAEQLAQFSNDPKYDLHTFQKRPDDEFQKKIEMIMKTIEEKMEKSEYTARIDDDTGIKARLKPPACHGVDQYTIWVTQLRRPFAMVEDAQARRFLESCRRQLEFYNSSIGINDECETEDALNYLNKQFEQLNENIGSRAVEIDTFLKDLFEKNKPYLDNVARNQANTNPKLIKLEEMLLKAFREEPDSRAMVFVKTRDLAAALQQWMMRKPKLKQFKPGKIVGAGPSTEKGGMTKNQQVDVMEYFRVGDHRVMVATSVAEEGLDIRKCNLVIRYNHVTNEIAMVQARGRARAENSRFVTLASEGKGVQEKDEINLIREIMMREAIRELQHEMREQHGNYHKQIEDIQKEEKSMRDIEASQRKGRQLREGEVVLHCRTCDNFACMSSDIRTLEHSHHVIVDLDFRERSIEKPHPKPSLCGIELEKKGKLHCKKCGADWGIVVRYRNTKFPVIKIDSFIIIDDYGKRDAPKKWKNTNFAVQELTLPELEKYRIEANGVGYVFEN